VTLDPPKKSCIGFIGLGNMGRPMAQNLAAAGFEVVAADAAPIEPPDGVTLLSSAGQVAQRASIVVLSLPDGPTVAAVAEAIVSTNDAIVRDVVDTSTVGPGAARQIAATLASIGVSYVDAPVSGGVAGAKAGTITVMFSGPDDSFARVEPALLAISSKIFRVGLSPGQGQAMKVANNFLNACTLLATSEAVAFGVHFGLELPMMLDVINASSGRSGASDEKFPRHIVPGTYASGFAARLMAKDVTLFMSEDEAHRPGDRIGEICRAVWSDYAEREPTADFTRIHEFLSSPAAQ
jgi:3-hydroxyisobutyrate dehydrogenase